MQTTLLLLLLLPLSHAAMRVPPASVARALPAARRRVSVPSRRGRVTMDAFPERVDNYEDETASLKAAIRVAHVAGDSAGLCALVESLELLNPTERCATSPLLDGFWDTLYASKPAAWTRGGRLRHVIESWSEGDAPGMGMSSSPGMPGLLSGPRGTAWTDVAEGRGAYVQRARLRFGFSRELRATYNWLGGDAWEVRHVSQARLLLGIPLWRRTVRDGASVALDPNTSPSPDLSPSPSPNLNPNPNLSPSPSPNQARASSSTTRCDPPLWTASYAYCARPPCTRGHSRCGRSASTCCAA